MDLEKIGAIVAVVLMVVGAMPALLMAIVAFLKVLPGDQGEAKLESIANTLQKLVNAIPKK